MMFDVAVIGLGPVGATLANLLAAYGLSVAVLEREATPMRCPGGALRRRMHAGVRRDRRRRGSRRRLPCVARHEVPQCRRAAAGGLAPAAGGRRAGLACELSLPPAGPGTHPARPPCRTAGATVHLRCEVYAIEAAAERATVRYEDLRCGRLAAIEAAYVIGADGARSLVRRLIGSEMEDLGLHERWLVFDALLKRPWSVLGDHSVQFCDPARPPPMYAAWASAAASRSCCMRARTPPRWRGRRRSGR